MCNLLAKKYPAWYCGNVVQINQEKERALNSLFKIEPVHRINVFVGAYGSGKSEVSVNFAFWLRGLGHQVSLCDLDIINPYFRSADARQLVTGRGIRLIAPVFAGSNIDVPAVPAELGSVFLSDDFAVLDIGGEDMGARVLGTIRHKLAADDHAVYMVVNTCRPFTATSEQIVWLAGELARASGSPVTGLVHNSNLLGEDDYPLLNQSLPIVQEAADQLGVPLVFAAAMAAAVSPGVWGKTAAGLPLLRLERTIKYSSG